MIAQFSIMTTHAEFEPQTTEVLLTVCLFAALADGDLSESERESLKKLAGDVGGETADVMREVLLGQRNLGSVGTVFDDAQERVLAYEMARAVASYPLHRTRL
jgi:uncharacterized membrane protein YebE (DUF533 family)